jgi:hypothetical protein
METLPVDKVFAAALDLLARGPVRVGAA